MIYFPPFGGSGLSLASTGGGVVVEGLDLDRRIDGWPNGDIWLLRMGAHSCTAMHNKTAAGGAEGLGVGVSVLAVGGSQLLRGLEGGRNEGAELAKPPCSIKKMLALSSSRVVMGCIKRSAIHPFFYSTGFRWTNPSPDASSNRPKQLRNVCIPSYLPRYGC